MINWLLWAALLQSASTANLPEFTRDDVTLNLAAWIARGDQNGDAKLSREEWHAVLELSFQDMPDTYLRRMAERDLGYYDRNRDGFVDLAELAALSLAGFACLDADHNGRLSAAEQAAGAQATCIPTRTISD